MYSGRKNGVSLVGPAGQQPRYAASGKKSPAKLVATKGQSISVRGFKLAKIRHVSPRNTGGVIPKESLQMGSWKGIQQHDSVPDEIWRTLVADRDPDGQIPPTWYQRACMRCLEIADTFNNGDLNVGELLQGHSEMLRKYLTRVRNVTWNRTFFNGAMTRNSAEKGGLEKHAHDLDAVSEEHVDNSSGGLDKGAENVVEKDGVNDSNDASEKSGTDKKDDILENGNGVKGQEEVPAINKTENLVVVLDESLMPDLEEASENEIRGSGKTRDDDNIFGLGPPGSGIDDLVCILFGCSVPVILRKERSGGHYTLVGEAYVHGMMDGEAMEYFGRRKLEEETFELQ